MGAPQAVSKFNKVFMDWESSIDLNQFERKTQTAGKSDATAAISGAYESGDEP
jgi:hypothetical protein